MIVRTPALITVSRSGRELCIQSPVLAKLLYTSSFVSCHVDSAPIFDVTALLVRYDVRSGGYGSGFFVST